MARSRFAWFDVFMSLVSTVTLLLNIGTDMAVTWQLYMEGRTVWWALTATFVILPLVVTSAISLKWHSVDRSLISPGLLLPHVCLVVPFHRYARVLWLGLQSALKGHPRHTDAALREQNDTSILRLVETFLESAPQLMVQLSFMLLCQTFSWLLVFSAACSLLSMSWALTMFCDSSRLNYETPYIRRCLAVAVHWLWQLFVAVARVTPLVLFTSVLQAWVCLFVGLHWVAMTLWIWLRGCDLGESLVEKVMLRVASGFIYVFAYLNLQEGPSRSWMVPYYILVLLENGCLFVVWIVYSKPSVDMKVAASLLVFAAFFLGGLCMMVYYRWLHPSGPHYIFSVRAKLPAAHLMKGNPRQLVSDYQIVNSSAVLSKNSILELSVESEASGQRVGAGESIPFLLQTSVIRDELESAWQSGMQSGSDDSSTTSSNSSLDLQDCNLQHMNATARSGSLQEREQPQGADSACEPVPYGTDCACDPDPHVVDCVCEPAPHCADTSQQSLQPSDYSVTPSSARMQDVKDTHQTQHVGRTEGTVSKQRPGKRSKIRRIKMRLVNTPPLPSRPSLQRHPSSTPTTAKPQHVLSKIHLCPESAASKFSESKLHNCSDVASSDVGPSQPGSHTSVASDMLPSGKHGGVVGQLSRSLEMGQSPIVDPESGLQSPRGLRSDEVSFIKVGREAMAPYPDIVDSLSPDPRQPKLYLGSDDMYGDRAGGESMWGISPDISNTSSSQSKEQPAGTIPQVSSFHESPCVSANCHQSQHPPVDVAQDGGSKSCSASHSPAVDSQAVDSPATTNTTETSWTSMNVNENEWSGLNNLKALTPDESLCSFASNDQEPEEHGDMEEEEDGGKPLKVGPRLGTEDGAFSRCSTPTSMLRSRSTSSLYNDFSSAGVSPSPPPGLKTATRGMSRYHSWVSSHYSSQPVQHLADTTWPLGYPSVDPAPPVDSDLYSSHSSDPREVVIQMLMDQLRRSSLRSSQYQSPGFSPLSPCVVSPSRTECWEREALRRLMCDDANTTLVPHSDPRRSYTGDIDLMRKALDLIERERFPHRFQHGPHVESPEMYVSGQYRPPILDQGREPPQHPSVLRVAGRDHSGCRSQSDATHGPIQSHLNRSSLSRGSAHSSSCHETSAMARSGYRAHNSPGVDATDGGMGAGPGGVGREREGLYRYFVHSDSPVHTPLWNTRQTKLLATPSTQHLLQKYLTQQGMTQHRVQCAETRTLRTASGGRDQLAATLPAGALPGQVQLGSDAFTAHTDRISSTVPPDVVAYGRIPDHYPHSVYPQGGRAPQAVPHSSAVHHSVRADTAQQHSLAQRSGRTLDLRHFSQKLEVQTDHPDSGMQSGSHSGMPSGTQSAASRRHPLQSLDNSPSLSPSSVTQQPVFTKPVPQPQSACSPDKRSHSAGRSSSRQLQMFANPDSPKHSSRSSRTQSPRQTFRSRHGGQTQADGQKQGDRSSDRGHRAVPSSHASDGSAVARAKSVDCLR